MQISAKTNDISFVNEKKKETSDENKSFQ